MSRIPLFVILLVPAIVSAPEEQLRHGNAAYERGDYDAAVTSYQQAEDRATDPGLVALNEAAALYQSGRYREAELHYRCCLEDALDSRRTHALYGLGTALLRQGRQRGSDVLREAIRCLDECALRPDAGADLVDDARHNLELAKLLLLERPPKSSDQSEKEPREEENHGQPPPRPIPESSAESVGDGKADSQGDKQRVRRDQAKDAKQSDEGTPGAGSELPPVPDQDDLAPLSRADAEEHLRRAAARILSEQRTYRKQHRARRQDGNGLDW